MLSPEKKLRVSWSFWLLVLAAAFVSPLLIVLSVLLAAALHECGHLLALRLFRVGIEQLRLSARGASLHAAGVRRLSYGRELAVTLAGPAMNLLCGTLAALCALRFAWEDGFVLAGAHIILCAFNLLPIPPLDGSRALYLVSAFLFGPLVGDAVAAVVGGVCALVLAGFSVWLRLETGAGTFFLLAAWALLFGALPQLRLAKNAVRV